MQSLYTQFTQFIFDFFSNLTNLFYPWIPFGPIAWFVILVVFTPMLIVIALLVVRGRRGTSSKGVEENIRKIIASTGDVSSGMAGVKKLKFLKTPAEALVFLKVEENAIQQALSAIEYYAQQGQIDDSMKSEFVEAYQNRLEVVRGAIAKDEEYKEIVDTSIAVDRARSDYLQKLAAMSGTAVETDDSDVAGPASVGMPSSTAPSGGVPSGGPPGGGPPGGSPPSRGPPSGGVPSGGPSGGGPPGGGPPSGGSPGGGPPSGGVPSGGPPGGGPPGGGAPSGGPPGGTAPSGGSPSGGLSIAASGTAPASTSGKSSLQSEMLQEMERLKALMGGD